MNLSNAYAPLMVSLNVAVPASRNEFNTFSASCSAEMAISLADGRMDSTEFMQEIMKNIKIMMFLIYGKTLRIFLYGLVLMAINLTVNTVEQILIGTLLRLTY